MAFDFIDLLHQVSGWAGGAGAAAMGEVYRRFRSSEKLAKEAKDDAANALTNSVETKATIADVRRLFVEDRKIVEDSRTIFEQTKQGLRLELDQFRSEMQKKIHEIEERELRLARGSRPDLMSVEEMQRQIDQLRGRIDEVKNEVGRERDQRYSIEREISESAKDESKWKASLNKSLGSIEAQIEMLMEEVRRTR